MAFSGNFGKIDPRFYFEVFQILKNFKMNLGLFIPNCPQTHAITNTYTVQFCNHCPIIIKVDKSHQLFLLKFDLYKE